MYKRTKLTGNISYRRQLFTLKVIAIVEVCEQIRAKEPGETLVPMPIFSPPADHPNPQQYIAKQVKENESKWVTLRTYYRDATMDDLANIAIMSSTADKNKAEYA